MIIENSNYLVFQSLGLSHYPAVNVVAEVRRYDDLKITDVQSGYKYAYLRKTLKDFRNYDEKSAAAFMAFMTLNYEIAVNVPEPKPDQKLINYFAIMYILPDQQNPVINANIIEADDINQCYLVIREECQKDKTLKESNFVVLYIGTQSHENMQYLLPEYKAFQYNVFKQELPQASVQPITADDIYNIILSVQQLKEEPEPPKVLETDDQVIPQNTDTTETDNNEGESDSKIINLADKITVKDEVEVKEDREVEE